MNNKAWEEAWRWEGAMCVQKAISSLASYTEDCSGEPGKGTWGQAEELVLFDKQGGLVEIFQQVVSKSKWACGKVSLAMITGVEAISSSCLHLGVNSG